MKKLLLIIGTIFLMSPVFANDEVYLDVKLPEILRVNTGKLQYDNTKKSQEDDMEYLKPSFGQLKDMFKEDFCETKKNNSEN